MGVFTKLFKKTKEKTSAQKAKERLLSVCIAQTNTTGEERSELIQKIKAAVIQVVNEYYQTKLEADKISVGKIDSSDDELGICTCIKHPYQRFEFVCKIKAPDCMQSGAFIFCRSKNRFTQLSRFQYVTAAQKGSTESKHL